MSEDAKRVKVAGSREARLQEVLRELRIDNHGVEAAVLVSSDAIPLVCDVAETAQEEVLSAMAFSVNASCERASDELERGALKQLYMWGDSGDLAVVRINEDLLLACMIRRGSRGGDTLRDVMHCADKLARIV